MNYIFKNENITEGDINKLFENEIEESINLDFKQKGSLSKSDGKKKEISKDVASFANSDGGIIIYGIVEENHKAKSLSFIDGEEFTKEWLEQTIQSNIHRNIPKLRIVPIRFDKDVKKTIYVVIIPESFNAPHMSKDNKYYKRHNFQSVPMEEYEVRQLFNKKGLSDLEIFGVYINEYYRNDYKIEGYNSFALSALVSNTSSFIEEKYKTVLNLHHIDKQIKVSVPSESKADIIGANNFVKVSTPGNADIFQGETLICGMVYLDVPEKHCDELLNDIKIDLQLLFSTSKKEKSYLMEDIYSEYTHNKRFNSDREHALGEFDVVKPMNND